MKVISVVNQKGGCGKTTISVNLSAALSKRNLRVLLIDLDPQAHATFSLKQEGMFTITDILESISNDGRLPQDMTYSAISENFNVIPSSIGLATMEQKLAERDDKLEILSSFLKQIESEFDFCILDCPPNLGIITLNALWASTYSLIPLAMCDFSLKGIEMLKNIFIMLQEFKGTAPVAFYLLNQVDRRSKFSIEFAERVKNQLGSMVLKTVIRTNVHLREAVSNGKNIMEYKIESRGAQDFTSLAQELEKISSRTKWAPLFLKDDRLQDVYVVGDFNNWQKEDSYRLRKIGNDIWTINIPLEKGEYRYKFLAQDSWITDPYNELKENDAFGGKNSLIRVE